MKTQFVKTVMRVASILTIVCAFFLFTSLEKDEPNPAKEICCTGYNIPMSKLLQFMLDSLKSNQFEGGIYSKADLINAINSAPGDSIYLLNFLVNCSMADGTDLAITSKSSTKVFFVRKKHCPYCPGMPCCRSSAACVAKINRVCINYKTISGFANNDVNSSTEAFAETK